MNYENQNGALIEASHSCLEGWVKWVGSPSRGTERQLPQTVISSSSMASIGVENLGTFSQVEEPHILLQFAFYYN